MSQVNDDYERQNPQPDGRGDPIIDARALINEARTHKQNESYPQMDPAYEEPSRFRDEPTDDQSPHWLDDDTLNILKDCHAILNKRCGRRGNGLDNLEILGRFAGDAFVDMSGNRDGIYRDVKPHYGGVVMILSKLQRIMTEDLHRDDYVDAINYILLTYAMRKRAQANEPTDSKVSESH